MSTQDALISPEDRHAFVEFDIEPTDVTYLQSISETLTPDICDWITAQWQAEVETLSWFDSLQLTPAQVAGLVEKMSSTMGRLLTGEGVEELYGEMQQMALVALRRGVRNTDVFQAFTKLEAVLTGVVLQLFPGSDQQTVALVTLAKFLKLLLYAVMETYRREAANELEWHNQELQSALEQQTATAQVLQVINSSPGNLKPVFEVMLEKATGLCEASFGILWRFEDELAYAGALYRLPEKVASIAREPVHVEPASELGRIVRDKAAYSVANLLDYPPYRAGDPLVHTLVEQAGARSMVVVPLSSDDVILGAIAIYRQETAPFSDKQLSLLENFASQAVIAMENERLLRELHARTEELAQRQAELRVTFDNVGNGVVMFNKSNMLAAWNQQFVKLLNVPDTFLDGSPTFSEFIRFLATRGEYGNVEVEKEVRRFADAATRSYSFERTRPDGTVVEIRHNALPGGGIVVIYSDITERKRYEETLTVARDRAEAALSELRTAQDRLIHAEKMASLGQLTAGIAHEIKNPLNFVNNFSKLSAEMMDELAEVLEVPLAALSEDQRDDAEDLIGTVRDNLLKIDDHGRRADSIVKNMLMHARAGSGEAQSVDINAIALEAINLAYHGARAVNSRFNVEIESDLSPDVGAINGQPQELQRVFLNLCSNGMYAAVERTADGGDGAKVSIRSRANSDAYVIEVSDNGSGISEEIREKIFQPFFTTKPTGEGTGLGLSMSYDIVKQHGGSISLDSETGVGTIFRVSFPR